VRGGHDLLAVDPDHHDLRARPADHHRQAADLVFAWMPFFRICFPLPASKPGLKR